MILFCFVFISFVLRTADRCLNEVLLVFLERIDTRDFYIPGLSFLRNLAGAKEAELRRVEAQLVGRQGRGRMVAAGA